MAPQRTFDDKQASRILARAVALQHRARTEAPSQGLTLADLEAAARDAGIDPLYLAQAVQTTTAVPQGWLGGPLVLEQGTVIEVNASEEHLKDLQMQLGLLFGVPGTGMVHRGRLAWDARDDGSTSSGLTWHLEVEPGEGGTRVSLTVDLKTWAWALHGGVGGGVGLGLGLSLALTSVATGQPWGWLALPLCLVGAWGLSWGLFRATTLRMRAKVRRLVDRIAERLRVQGAPTRTPDLHLPRPED